MKTIPINQIHPSPNPIRKTWDEGKMEELAESIRERGMIVPIKVRPNADGFEIVYGHRRVEAARRVNLWDVPAIVEGVDDTDALIQALIENVQREDMEPMDLARALKELQFETGLNKLQLGRQFGKSHSWVNNHFLLLEEDTQVQELLSRIKPGPSVEDDLQLGVRHVYEVRGSGLDQPDRTKVLLKAAEEGLTRHDVRAVADAYKSADTPELKEAVLQTSGKLGDKDRILDVAKAKLADRHVTELREDRQRKAFEEFDTAVKDFLDAIRMFDHMIGAAKKAAEYGKFGPEAKPFTIRKIDRLIEELNALREVLNNG